MDGLDAEQKGHIIRVRTLFDGGMKQNEIKETLLTTVCNKCCQHNQKRIQDLAKNFSIQFRKRWLAVNRTKRVFLNKNKNWLNKSLLLNCISVKKLNSCGRPKLEFGQLSYSGKFRRTENLRKSDSSELLFAVQMNLKADGQKSTAKGIHNLVTKNNTLNESGGSRSQLSSERALALTVDARLSKRQYQELRNVAKENNSNLYPSYNQLREAKRLCYPNDITVTEHSASVKLQSLLDHTTCRLLSTLELDGFKGLKQCALFMISKWGMDGSSGQKEYKQAFEGDYSDTNLLLTCLVPLQLYTRNKRNKKIVIWNNPLPSSTRYCRPCKIQFLKENIEVSKIEYAAMQAEINNLIPTKFLLNEHQFNIKHELYMSMIDTKMINSLTDTSSQKCYLCGAAPNEMNDIEKVSKKPIKDEYLKFGITSLHLWIRSFECLLKISYRLSLKKWQARGEDKLIINEQKRKIQSEFKSRLGIIVDQPKQGSGTSNDGNCARHFFRNYDISAEITGLDKALIYRFFVILQVVASGINVKKSDFDTYAMETAKYFVSKYPWYKMPAGIHKMLIHGSTIVQSAPLPIGQFSEEAQEARNKEYRRYREHHSRKFNRVATNIDVLNNMLVSSDPRISSLRKRFSIKKRKFCPEALNLLQPAAINGGFDSDTSSEDGDSE